MQLFLIQGDNYIYRKNSNSDMLPFFKRLKQKKFIDIPEFIFSLSYTQPRAYAAMFFYLTGDSFYYDHLRIKAKK